MPSSYIFIGIKLKNSYIILYKTSIFYRWVIINDKEKISYICKNNIIGNNHEYRSREFRHFKRISKKIAN